MSTFKIDFFEFAFLVEACLPPKPIARAMFFNDVSDFHYHQMTKDERTKLYYWIKRLDNYDEENEETKHFFARFNPDNQVLVKTKNGESIEAYKYNKQLHTKKETYINNEFITDIIPI